LIDTDANRRAVFSKRGLRSTDWSGAKDGPLKAPRTMERSHGGTEGGLEGLILPSPFRNLTTRSFHICNTKRLFIILAGKKIAWLVDQSPCQVRQKVKKKTKKNGRV